MLCAVIRAVAMLTVVSVIPGSKESLLRNSSLRPLARKLFPCANRAIIEFHGEVNGAGDNKARSLLVLPTSAVLAEYLKDVRAKFVAGIAAPLVGEGGMIGYLLQGFPKDVFDKLADELGQRLLPVSEFSTREHLSSRHERREALSLRLHHMIMELAKASVSN